MAALAKHDWPEACRRPECAGIYVGGCVARGEGSRFHAKAHAHLHGPFKGWLCFLSEKRLRSSELVLHELAHLVAGCGHTDEWRKTLLAMGGTLKAVIDPCGPGLLLKNYEKRTRA